MPRCVTSSAESSYRFSVFGSPGSVVVGDAVEAGAEQRRGGQVRVRRAVDRADLDPARRRDADRLRAVVHAVGGVGGRPGRAGGRRADADPLVRVHRRRADREHRLGVVDDAAEERVREGREAEAARIVVVREQVRRPGRVPQRDVQVRAVAGQVRERLRHERRQVAALLRHRVDEVAEEDRPVGGDDRVVVLEVRLELAVRVLVVVRVVAPAELVLVLRERRDELVVPRQALHVVAGLVERIEVVQQLRAGRRPP